MLLKFTKHCHKLSKVNVYFCLHHFIQALAEDIKYAAYRTAVKLRAIEKKIQGKFKNTL